MLSGQTSPKQLLAQYQQKWLLLAAGPSLDSHWQQIADLHSQGYHIACCDMIAAAACARGLKPSLIFTCEPRPFNFFSWLPKLHDAGAVLPASAHHWQQRQLYQKGLRQFCYFNWQSEEAGGLPVLPDCGNVGNAMVVFLGGIKNARLLLFGYDFGFEGSPLYARGAAHLLNFLTKRQRDHNYESFLFKRLITLRPEHGPDTTRQYQAYKQWLLDYLPLLRKNNTGVEVTFC